MNQNIRPSRITYIEWIRALAAIAVVALHTVQTPSTTQSIEELGYLRALTYTEFQILFTRWAVPAFFMVTGVLLLDPKKNITWTKQKTYIWRMVKVLLTFGFGFCLVDALAGGEQILPALLEALTQLIAGHSWSHMWYIYALIGIYLLLPILRAYVAQAEQSDYRRMLIILFIVSFALPALAADTGVKIVEFFTFSRGPFYLLLGRYLATWCHLNKRIVVLGALSISAGGIFAAFTIMNSGSMGLQHYNYYAPFIPLYASLVFLAFKDYAQRPLWRPIKLIAVNSFGIYLIHPIFLRIFYRLFPLPLPPVILEISIFALALAGSLLLSMLLRKLPVFSRIL